MMYFSWEQMPYTNKTKFTIVYLLTICSQIHLKYRLIFFLIMLS